MDSNSAIHKFVARQRELLDLELQTESDEGISGTDSNDNEGRRSHILGRLEASDVSVGLYGRTVVRLTPWSSSLSSQEGTSGDFGKGAIMAYGNAKGDNPLSLLPAHRFTVGNEVEIKGGQGNKKNVICGVICAVSEQSISIAIEGDKLSASQPSKSSSKGGKVESKKNKFSKNDDGDDETSILDCAPLTLVPRSSVEVHKKLVAALDRLERHGENHPIAGSIIRSVFSSKDEATRPCETKKKSNPNACFNSNLDESQREAIDFALNPERPIALIHGPPGTGKTTTVAELIRQAVHYHGMRVLVTAPSNVAVDNILEKLTQPGDKTNKEKLPILRTVRLGHPARIKPSIAKHGLEALVKSSDGTEIVDDVRRELESHLRSLSRDNRKPIPNPNQTPRIKNYKQPKRQQGNQRKLDKRSVYKEIKLLRKEIRQREEKVVSELIRSAHVVCATNVGADNHVLNQITNPKDANLKQNSEKLGFDLVIIDEAAQALEASCWIPILRGRKVVLAGDHCQLPPTIKSNNPTVLEGLGVTLFERLMAPSNMNSGDKNKNRDVSRMLQIQYRMHHKIADWASQAMYQGKLCTHESVRDRTLGQLDEVQRQNQRDSNNSSPLSISTHSKGSYSSKETTDDSDLEHLSNSTLLLVDTAGCDLHEGETEAGSRYNEGEAMLVVEHVRKLLKLGLDQSQIAIITPYNGQVELLRNQLLPQYARLEIRSVDGFQGGEREAVVLSLVRSNYQHSRGNGAGIGFLRDDRRQNVAVTRAMRHLAVICDSDTVSKSPFIRDLLQWIEDNGEERSAVEYISEGVHSESQEQYEEDLKDADSELMKLFQDSASALTLSSNPSVTSKKSMNDSLGESELMKIFEESASALHLSSAPSANRGSKSMTEMELNQLFENSASALHLSSAPSANRGNKSMNNSIGEMELNQLFENSASALPLATSGKPSNSTSKTMNDSLGEYELTQLFQESASGLNLAGNKSSDADGKTMHDSRGEYELMQLFHESGSALSLAKKHRDGSRSRSMDDSIGETELTQLFEGSASALNLARSRSSSPNKFHTPPNDLIKETPGAQLNELEESKRKALMDKVATFLAKGAEGDEMVLSSDLSSYDRRLVHEFAEQSGLGHKSEGTEGIDRKTILWIKNDSSPSTLFRQEATLSSKKKEAFEVEEEEDGHNLGSKLVSNFSALALDNDDSDDSDSDATENDTNQESTPSKGTKSDSGGPTANELLKQLAKERAERQQHQRTSDKTSSKKKKSKPKGRKLGGAKKAVSPPDKDDTDDLDDMAFLDAQIEKSQNTHGRKVVGSGKNYRTVVNGILNAKPEPRSKPSNQRASAALKMKLSKAENSRKKKKKK